jgi:hypothetical protein
MLHKLCTLFLVALALSPFTAPFQTYSPTEMACPIPEDEKSSGTSVASLATDSGRLKIAAPVGIITVSLFIPESLGTRLGPPIERATPVIDRSTLSTILRL